MEGAWVQYVFMPAQNVSVEMEVLELRSGVVEKRMFPVTIGVLGNALTMTDVTTPKVPITSVNGQRCLGDDYDIPPPPPLNAQKRFSFSPSCISTILPSAVTAVIASTLSAARP